MAFEEKLESLIKRTKTNDANIQAIDSIQYSCDEMALLFARQLIK